MRLLADLHVHTLASDGYCTVNEVAAAARLRGLEMVAVTDHGPALGTRGAEDWYFRNLRVVASMIDGIRVLKGCEANIVPDSENLLDIDDRHLERLDFVTVGFHPGLGFDERDRVRNSEALLRVMENPLADMVVHPGNEKQFPVDLEAVVGAAANRRVILEINNHSFDEHTPRSASIDREREFALAAAAADAPVAICSDAHSAVRIGVFDAAIALAEEVGLAERDIVNRSAESVLAFLRSRRERVSMDVGGIWNWRGAASLGENVDCADASRRRSARDAEVLEAIMRLKHGAHAESEGAE